MKPLVVKYAVAPLALVAFFALLLLCGGCTDTESTAGTMPEKYTPKVKMKVFYQDDNVGCERLTGDELVSLNKRLDKYSKYLDKAVVYVAPGCQGPRPFSTVGQRMYTVSVALHLVNKGVVSSSNQSVVRSKISHTLTRKIDACISQYLKKYGTKDLFKPTTVRMTGV